jgi:DNA-binding NarL/FixJ family response regulator
MSLSRLVLLLRLPTPLPKDAVPPVRVVVVDDHDIVRSGVVSLLSREADISVVGSAATGEGALHLIGRRGADVAILDYSMPGMTGSELCQEIRRRFPSVSVIMLTSYLDDNVVAAAMRAGARAYVYKDVVASDLVGTIRSVVAGRTVIDHRVSRDVLGATDAKRPRRPRSDPLSAREIEVLRLVARGSSNKDIALTLGLTENTVKTYLRRVLEKLDCHSRSQAAAIAVQRGLL